MAGAVSHCGCRDGGRLAIAVFVYGNTSKQVGHLKVLATADAAAKTTPEASPLSTRFLECTTYVVPELTRNADIKLNTRVSLQLIQTGIACRLVAQDLSPSTA